jgi:hypothetical protein
VTLQGDQNAHVSTGLPDVASRFGRGSKEGGKFLAKVGQPSSRARTEVMLMESNPPTHVGFRSIDSPLQLDPVLAW